MEIPFRKKLTFPSALLKLSCFVFKTKTVASSIAKLVSASLRIIDFSISCEKRLLEKNKKKNEIKHLILELVY